MIKVVSLVIGSLKSNDLSITITTYHLIKLWFFFGVGGVSSLAHAYAHAPAWDTTLFDISFTQMYLLSIKTCHLKNCDQ